MWDVSSSRLCVCINSLLNASLKFLAPSLMRVFGRFTGIAFAFLNKGLILAVYFISARTLFHHPLEHKDISYLLSLSKIAHHFSMLLRRWV
jgi:hypothetical protein